MINYLNIYFLMNNLYKIFSNFIDETKIIFYFK